MYIYIILFHNIARRIHTTIPRSELQRRAGHALARNEILQMAAIAPMVNHIQ